MTFSRCMHHNNFGVHNVHGFNHQDSTTKCVVSSQNNHKKVLKRKNKCGPNSHGLSCNTIFGTKYISFARSYEIKNKIHGKILHNKTIIYKPQQIILKKPLISLVCHGGMDTTYLLISNLDKDSSIIQLKKWKHKWK